MTNPIHFESDSVPYMTFRNVAALLSISDDVYLLDRMEIGRR